MKEQVEDKSFIERCNDLMPHLKTDYVKSRITETRDELLSKYIAKLIKQLEN